MSVILNSRNIFGFLNAVLLKENWNRVEYKVSHTWALDL